MNQIRIQRFNTSTLTEKPRGLRAFFLRLPPFSPSCSSFNAGRPVGSCAPSSLPTSGLRLLSLFAGVRGGDLRTTAGNTGMSAKKQEIDVRSQPPPIKLVKSKKAFNLALKWVSEMSGGWGDEQDDVEFEGRPPRVGLGAETFCRSESRQPNNEATEWKLRAMLDSARRKTSAYEESAPNVKNTPVSDEEEDETESRCNAFTKKVRANPSTAALQGKKRKRK